MSVRTIARGLIGGVSWKNPVVNTMVHAVDPVDFLVRSITRRRFARGLNPGDRCFFTAFLLDGRAKTEFPFKSEQHSYANQVVPGIAVAYSLDLRHLTAAKKRDASKRMHGCNFAACCALG